MTMHPAQSPRYPIPNASHQGNASRRTARRPRWSLAAILGLLVLGTALPYTTAAAATNISPDDVPTEVTAADEVTATPEDTSTEATTPETPPAEDTGDEAPEEEEEEEADTPSSDEAAGDDARFSSMEDLTPPPSLPPDVVDTEVLKDAGDFPWYDADTARVRPIAPAGEPPAPQPLDWEWLTSSNSNTSSNSWAWLADVVQWIAWGVLLVIFGLLLYLPLKRLLYPPNDDAALDASPAGRVRSEVDSIEQLPFPVPVAQSDLLGEARRCYDSGRYRDAMIYLYSYQLVQLDQHQKIHLSKGKTNRQYLHELKPHGRLRELVSQSVRLFEDAFFGHYELPRDRFESAWSRLDEFQQLARQATG